MSYLLQRNQPLALPPTLSSHNGVLATTITLGFLSASLSCGPNCVSGDCSRAGFEEPADERYTTHAEDATGGPGELGEAADRRPRRRRECHALPVAEAAPHGGRSIQAGEQGEPRRARREH